MLLKKFLIALTGDDLESPDALWRLRDGWVLCGSHADADKLDAGGPHRAHVMPRAVAGDLVKFSPEELSAILCRGQLGMFEPVNAAARAVYGQTVPMVPKHIREPHLTIRDSAQVTA